MDDTTKKIAQAIAIGAVKKGLMALGAAAAAHGVSNGFSAEIYSGAAVAIVAAGWSFWNDYGKAIVLSQLEVMKAKSLAQAAKLQQNSIAPVTTTEIAAQSPKLTATDVAKTMATVKPLLLVGALLTLFLAHGEAFAADMTLKAPAIKDPFAGGYPTAHCGAYFGINTMGSAGQVTGSVAPGTQVVQGDIGATIGYTCPLSADGSTFWFVEGMFDIANLNGSSNGLALSGPAVFEQRFALGSPISSMLSMFPSLSFPALPSLPGLPNGVTAGPAYPYMFAAVHEQDISASLGLANNRQWLISPGVGVGLLTRLSNNVVADVFAEWQMQSNSLSLGPVAGAPHLGNTARVGFSLKY